MRAPPRRSHYFHPCLFFINPFSIQAIQQINRQFGKLQGKAGNVKVNGNSFVKELRVKWASNDSRIMTLAKSAKNDELVKES